MFFRENLAESGIKRPQFKATLNFSHGSYAQRYYGGNVASSVRRCPFLSLHPGQLYPEHWAPNHGRATSRAARARTRHDSRQVPERRVGSGISYISVFQNNLFQVPDTRV